MKKERYIGILCVVIATILWGSNGIFVNLLGDTGMNSFETSSVRMIIAALIESVLFCFYKDKDRVRGKDLIWFALVGLIGMFGFVVAYSACITRVGMGVAAVLIYLMPTIVMIYSCIFSKEKLTFVKIAALLVNLVGCGLVSGIVSDVKADLLGIAFGILTAFCYAFNNIIVAKLSIYSPFTRMYYPSIFAAVFGVLYLVLFSEPIKIIGNFLSNPSFLFNSLLWAICCSMCPYYLFNRSLKGLNVTEASMLSTFELIFAVLFGIIFFNEPFDFANVIGAVLVFVSILII